MGHNNHYIYLNRLASSNHVQRGLAKICLDEYKQLPLTTQIKENFKKDIWKERINYVTYSVKYFLEKAR